MAKRGNAGRSRGRQNRKESANPKERGCQGERVHQKESVRHENDDDSKSIKMDFEESFFDGTEPEERGFNRTEPEESGFNRTELEKKGFNRTEPKESGFNRTELEKSGFNRTGAEESGINTAEPEAHKEAFLFGRQEQMEETWPEKTFWEREARRKKGADRCMIVEMAIIILLLILLILLSWRERNQTDTTVREMVEYEDNALSDTKNMGSGEDTETADASKEVNIAVMKDYVVTEDQPEFFVGYPNQNNYEIEISFRDPETGEEKYRTKRIAPGTQVSVPGYMFCEEGENRLDAVILIFDPESQELVSDTTTMQLKVTRE